MPGPHHISRRDFVKLTTVAVGAAIGAVIGVPSVAFLISPALRAGSKDAWAPIGNLEDIPVGEPFAFSFTRTQVNGWERTATNFGGFVLRKSEDPADILILSSRCTHLACQVSWQAESRVYVCPCHDAAFDVEGNVLDGPPPRPLDVYDEFQVDEGGNLLIHVKEG
ncbi:MAG: ubiquinol-cytochrome c reductase iron-sulfur subunit [Chloroflexi bacterium]|nr:ubiquinol-cytochrome c reductase iron-sulfur subunit [Chloroflexota bacterium]